MSVNETLSKKVYRTLKTIDGSGNKTWNKLAFWTTADQVELENGENIEDELVNINTELEHIATEKVSMKHPPSPLLGVNFDGTDETTKAQAIIDYVESKGGGTLYAPEGTIVVSNLYMPSYVSVIGSGMSTTFKQKAGSTGAVFNLKTNTSQMVGLYNFRIDGNKSNQSNQNGGISFINTDDAATMLADSAVMEHDARHHIENIYIYETKGNGFYIAGRGVSMIIGLQTSRCDGIGIYANSYDSTYANCDAGDSGLEGVYFGTGSPNTKMVNTKSWYSGRLDRSHGFGYYFMSDRLILSGLEAQDNTKHGFVFVGSDIVGSALLAEANGFEYYTQTAYNDGTGFLFFGCKNVNIQGIACDRFSASVYGSHQAYAVQLINNCANNYINIVSRNMKIGAYISSQLDSNNNYYDILEVKTNGVALRYTSQLNINQHLWGGLNSTLFDVTTTEAKPIRLNRYSTGKVAYMAGTNVEAFVMHPNGDIEQGINGKAHIMRSPNGTKYKLTVSDAGALVITAG